jgi:hypothetical protein
MNTKTTPTLGESLDHYGEEYCTNAVNSHEELLRLVKSFHMSNGNVHNECDACQAIRKAEGK